MMHNNVVGRIGIRIAWVIVCVASIFFFLYLPQLMCPDKKSLSILAWQQVIDKQYLADFEQQTGIVVHITYFDSNEELIAKLDATSDHGYDLIMPSDFFVPPLIKRGLIRPIDYAKINFFNTIYPELLNHAFDPNNNYTVPFFWGVIGIGIDKDYFGDDLSNISWKVLFDEQHHVPSVALFDDMYMSIAVAAQYLFASHSDLESRQLSRIEQLLLQQKRWVFAYTDFRTNIFLISKACQAVMAISSEIVKYMKWHNNIAFIIPKEGAFLTIDSFAIPSATKKDDQVYQFLNFLYQPEVLQKYVDKFSFFSPVRSVVNKEVDRALSVPMHFAKKNIKLIDHELFSYALDRIWLALKS